jgi:hypothetical protein
LLKEGGGVLRMLRKMVTVETVETAEPMRWTKTLVQMKGS